MKSNQTKYKLADLLDIPSIAQMFDLLYKIAHIPNAVIDMDGNILTSAGWQSICTDFHRANPESKYLCVQSDTHISNEIASGKPYVVYECPHGLVDSSCPIIIDGQHLGNVFTGQMLHIPLTDKIRDRFRQRAQQYGFNEKEYMATLEKVPVFPIEKHKEILKLLSNIAEQLANSGLVNLKALEQTKSLKESEENLRTTLNSIGDAVIATDIHGRITSMNPVAASLTGWTIEEARGKPLTHIFNIINNKTGREAENPVQKVLDFGKRVELTNHTMLVSKDGIKYQISDSGSPIKDDKNNITGVVLVFRDVTEDYRIRKALQDAERRYRTIADFTYDWEYWVNPDRSLNYISPSCEKISGYSVDYFMKNPTLLDEIVFDEDKSIWKKHILESLDHNRDEREIQFRIKNKDGKTVWIEHACNPVKNEQGIFMGYRCSNRDITIRKLAEITLGVLNQAVDTADEAMFMTDKKGIITLINPAFTKIYGYDAKDVIGKVTPRILKSGVMSPKDYDLFWETLLKGDVVSGELINKTKDGRLINIEGSANPILDKEKNIIGFLAIQRDITERKQAEKEKAAMEDQLLQANKMESIGVLAGGIAHDFNNILTPIMTYSELLLMDIPADDPKYKSLQRIAQSADRAKRLVNQILTLSRQDSLELIPVNLSQVIKDDLSLLRSAIPSQINIKKDIEPNCGVVLCDPAQINQIVMNLCTNAYQSMEKKGRLTVSLKAIELDENDAQKSGKLDKGKYVQLKVSDTGKGMDTKTLKRIYDPFYTTKKLGKGTGLGLSVVYGIVTVLGGEIFVESTLNQGTTFTVFLPVYQSKIEGTVANPEIVKGSGTILVVDDEEDVIFSTRKLLKRYGYQVTCKTKAKKALKLYRQNPEKFDLVILDQNMPKITGGELAEEMLSLNRDQKILMMTGFIDKEIEIKYKSNGIMKAIIKPFSLHAMLNTVQKMLTKGTD